ncbi:MAG: hypothetical protein ACOC0A_02580 [Planctomycetota bacterium]
MSAEVSQFKALGRKQLPETVTISGKPYELVKTYKHRFITAVGLYTNDDNLVICKFHRRTSFAGIPLDWLGSFLASYETENLRRCQGITGVPKLRETNRAGVLAHDYIPGTPLQKEAKISDTYFGRLFVLLEKIHARDMAYVDLEKQENILVGDDGQPHLIDFQIALRLPGFLLRHLRPVRWFLQRTQRSDHYHAMKHFRKFRPDLLTPEQIEQSKSKPLTVRLVNIIAAPVKQIRRSLFKNA